MIPFYNKVTTAAGTPVVRIVLVALFMALGAWLGGKAFDLFSGWRRGKRRLADEQARRADAEFMTERMLKIVGILHESDVWRKLPPHVVAHTFVTVACIHLRGAGYSESSVQKLLRSACEGSEDLYKELRQLKAA